MLNLVIGVLSGEFSKERELVENRSNYLKMKAENKLNKSMQGYLSWIQEGERLINRDKEAEERQALPTKPKLKVLLIRELLVRIVLIDQ